jgi:predicted DNA-binding transcriptional regulator AlpA
MSAKPLRIHHSAPDPAEAEQPQAGGDLPGAAPSAAKAKTTKRPRLSPDLAAERLIGIAELCELAGIGRSTAERWLAAGRLPEPIRLSRTCHRWRLASILEWIAAGCPDPRQAGHR